MRVEYPSNIVFKCYKRLLVVFADGTQYLFVVKRKWHKNLQEAIQKFHAKLLREHARDMFQMMGYKANMDQTPLTFDLDYGLMCDVKGAEEV